MIIPVIHVKIVAELLTLNTAGGALNTAGRALDTAGSTLVAAVTPQDAVVAPLGTEVATFLPVAGPLLAMSKTSPSTTTSSEGSALRAEENNCFNPPRQLSYLVRSPNYKVFISSIKGH